jgi:hypothetical protein
MFDHIIVGVEDRDSDRDALALAQRLGSSDAEITLAHIYPGDAGLLARTRTAQAG